MTDPTPPPAYQPGQDNPKAAAKAAKAYAKASRPWFKKKRFIIPAALVAIIAIGSVASGGGGDEPNQVADTSTSDNSSKADTPADDTPADDAVEEDSGTNPSTKFPKQNGDWRLDSFQTKDDGLGSFGGVGRITYTGDDSEGGGNVFTITVFEKDGTTVLATLTGSASDVKPGQTVTTQFISFDDYKSGKFALTFQNDL